MKDVPLWEQKGATEPQAPGHREACALVGTKATGATEPHAPGAS